MRKNIFFLTFIIFAASSGLVNSAPPVFDNARAQQTCQEKWTKRGNLDRRMFDYCLGKQRDGYSRASELYQKFSKLKDIDNIVNFAVEKWLTRREYQYDMVAYEIEKQGEAFLDVAYDLQSGKFTQKEVERCIGRWLTKAKPQWDMVSYCLRR